MPTPLEEILIRRIRRDGPLDMAAFMGAALGHPEYGYYQSRDPFGVAGDFTTAPEISQMFGELIGAWCVDLWQRMGSPAPFTLLECGPGRGTLMQDALRATAKVPGFHKAARVHLLETSPFLKEKQAESLAGFMPRWHETLESVPEEGPLILIANEFLDALPVRQLEKTPQGWRERVIGLDESGRIRPGTAAFPVDEVRIIPQGIYNGPAGSVFEFSPARLHFMSAVFERLKACGGAALFIDYGESETAAGDSLHAVYKHRKVGIFERIGESDLSANVDFNALRRLAEDRGIGICGPVLQGVFLRRLGIEARAQALMQKADEKQAADIEKALRRLTASAQMGALFKAMGFYHGSSAEPAGFRD